MGARLRYAREEVAKLSTVALAEALKQVGVTEAVNGPSVSRYEGGRVPSVEWLIGFATVTGVPLDWLVLNRTNPGEAGYVIERLRRLADELANPPDATAARREAGKSDLLLYEGAKARQTAPDPKKVRRSSGDRKRS